MSNIDVTLVDYNLYKATKKLCLLALNKGGNILEASVLLGVTPRTVSRYIKNFGIKKCLTGKHYYIPGEPETDEPKMLKVKPEIMQSVKSEVERETNRYNKALIDIIAKINP